MGYPLKQSQTAQPLLFLMVDSTDKTTGKTGLSPTVTLSKNGGSFATPSGAVTEIANGWYKVAGNATDSGTLGPLVLHATGTAADPCDDRYDVVAYDPQATSLGLVLAKTTNITGLNDIAATAIVSSGAITTSGGAVSTVTTTGTATNVTTVNGLAAGVITATSIASDAITDAKVASDVTIASVTGAVGSVTGDVGGKLLGGGSGTITGVGVNANMTQLNGSPVATSDGTAQAGATGSITLASGASSVNNTYVDRTVTITAGTGVGQSRVISAYVGSTKVATVHRNWDTTPDNTSTYSIGSTAVSASVAAGGITSATFTTDAISATAVSAAAVTKIQSGITPPTAAAIATAVWTTTTAGDFATASSPGKILVTQLGGAFTTTSSSVYSTASLANGPSGSGSSPATIADAVWDEARSGHVGAGSFGEGVASVTGTVNATVAGYATNQDPATILYASSPFTGWTLVRVLKTLLAYAAGKNVKAVDGSTSAFYDVDDPSGSPRITSTNTTTGRTPTVKS